MHLTALLYILNADWCVLLRIHHQFPHRYRIDYVLIFVLSNLTFFFQFQANLAVENYDDVLADAEKALELGV